MVNRESLNRQNPQMTLKPIPIFDQSKVTSSIIITMNLEFNSTKEETVLFHWNTLTLLGQLILIWMCYKRNGLTIIGMSIDSWKGFTKFTLLKDKPPKGYMWSGRRLTKIQTTTRPHGQNYGPKMVKPLRDEKNKNGKTRSQNSTMLDDWVESTVVDPDDEDYKEILKSARRKLERPVAPATPCKRQPSITKVVAKPEFGSEKNSKTVYGCLVESHESTRQRAESSQSKIVKITLQEKDLLRCLFPVWYTGSSRCQKRWKFRVQKPLWKKWKKLETIPAWNLDSQEQKGGYSGSSKRQKESPLCYIDGHLSPQKRGVGTKITEVQRQSRAPW